MRILLVEDDPAVASSLLEALRHAGFAVDHVASGADALVAPRPDLVLLDLGLPDVDGIEVCRRVRATSDVPIIIITARDAEIDRVVGLELGADDYVVKPFSTRELVARIRAVSRRSQGSAPSAPTDTEQVIGALRLDRRTRRVHLRDVEVALTPKEFDLLSYLADDPGAVFNRQQILEAVWDTHWYGPTKTLDAHVAALRRKLGDPGWIEAVRGVGFRLQEPG